MAQLGDTTYFVGHPLWHQQEWIKNGVNEFPCDLPIMLDSEMVFVNGVCISKHNNHSYVIQNNKLVLSESCDVREGDLIKIVYAWR